MKAAILILFVTISSTQAGNNVLLIIADDYGTDANSLYNNTPGATAPTPNINALADAGVRFANAYSCPVCSPTRACMITGRYGFRTGVGEVVAAPAGNSLTVSELTLPDVITQNSQLGIQSACFGKWHLSTGSGTANAPNTIGGWPHYAGSTGGVLTSYTSWAKVTNGVSTTSTTYATTDVVNDAVAWISARTAANQTWIAWVAFNAPHSPFHVPPTNLHSYGANPSSNLLKYRAAVEAMDTEIGRLLLAVNSATTDVIFIGDNGTPGSVIQTPYDMTHAKDTLYEGGIRVPLIVRGPSVVSGGRTDPSLVHAVDLFSTMLELAGVPLPSSVTLDSKSLKPILTKQSDSPRSRLYSDQFDQSNATVGGRMLRDDRYKIIRPNSGSDEFYDLTNDPAEATNLLAGGIAAMSESHQASYYRLRFNLGSYTTATPASALGHAISASGFSLTVASSATATQTMWQSTDLDFWRPVTGATNISSGGNVTFTAPAPLLEKAFYSVLSEAP
jgi:arylsulfatase A-like enzyme